MDSMIRYYDLGAQKTADEWYSNDLLLPLIKDFLSILKEKPRVLDLGCGTGHESKRLSNEGVDVVGIDISSESIKIAKEKNPNSTFHLMNFFSIDNSFGMFDAIFSTGSIIHLNEIELCKLLGIIYQRLNEGGYFLVVFQSGEGKRITYPEFEGEKVERIVERYSKELMITLFEKNGFQYVRDAKLDDGLKVSWIGLIFKK